jgi:glycosyltransferase involved in cell wall biosynthesis
VLEQAGERLAFSDLSAAERLADHAAELAPDHPEASFILGHCAMERGDAVDGVRKLLAAARSMRRLPLSAKQQYALWSDLGFLFTRILSGTDAGFASWKAIEYSNWLSSSASDKAGDTPLVSIVLLASSRPEWMTAATQSVLEQTYRNIELVVVHDRVDGASEALASLLLTRCPFPYRSVLTGDLDEAARINAGVRASGGAFVNVLDSTNSFPADRITNFVRSVVGHNRTWGFAKVEFVDRNAIPVGPAQESKVARAMEMFADICAAETVGFSFIDQTFVAVAVDNLFFERALFERLAGFRHLEHVYAWDFALRALWFDEPVYIPTVECACRLEESAMPESKRIQAEAAQLAMFREFYESACSEAVPPNPYAPSLHHWRKHFLKKPFQVGHVLAFPLERLEALSEETIEQQKLGATVEVLPGINLIGFAYGEFGLAENLRALANACGVGGIPFIVRDVDMRLKTRQADRTMAPHITDELRHACSVFCVNPDMLKPVMHLLRPHAGFRPYNVGFWFWELEQIPREWSFGIENIDEIWVATQFVADAMRRATSKPVIKMPTPVEVKISRPYTRREFALPEDRFLFLFSFDFNSFVKRKNPEATIAAFKRAFADARRDVGLVIKSINGLNNPAKLQETRALIGEDNRIVITDGFLRRDEVSGLESVVDAYVSLHRAEGFGLGLAEAMYLGKPVIGTAYSGNLEFMNGENSCLVDYRLVPIRRGEYLYDDERFHWADPDIEQAAWWMTRLVDDADFRDRIARRGQRDIRDRFAYVQTAAAIHGRLVDLGLL